MAAEDPSAPREPRPDSILTATTHAPSHRGDPGDPAEQYTGVVVIHGIGNQKRNSTLLEAVDALTYWINHHAGLRLHAEGASRVWLTTELRDDDDPDAEASRATLTLVAPSGIASGPDGKLWFTEYATGKIGRITPKGSTQAIQQSIREFPPPHSYSGPYAIVAGPDGNLWFLDFHAIGRISPKGSIQEFPLPSRNNAYSITTGPDSNLWFTDVAGPIGRMVTWLADRGIGAK
jgi:hypothetical protein